MKAKINSLPTYYSGELQKATESTKSGTGKDDMHKSKWAHFKSLKFLRDTIIPRRTKSNFVSNIITNLKTVYIKK